MIKKEYVCMCAKKRARERKQEKERDRERERYTNYLIENFIVRQETYAMDTLSVSS